MAVMLLILTFRTGTNCLVAMRIRFQSTTKKSQLRAILRPLSVLLETAIAQRILTHLIQWF